MEMIKLNDLSRWAKLASGEVISFAAGNPRKVRLQMNCQFETALFIVHVDELTKQSEERLLVTVPSGLSVVEFFTGGKPFRIGADTSVPVLYYTAEMEPSAVEVLDPEVFTKIAHRRARNPELEEMMFLVNHNMEKRLAQMDADHQRQLADLKAKGIEDAEVVRTGGDIHIGAPAQREKLAEAGDAGDADAVPAGKAKRRVQPGPDDAASAGEGGDDANGGEA